MIIMGIVIEFQSLNNTSSSVGRVVVSYGRGYRIKSHGKQHFCCWKGLNAKQYYHYLAITTDSSLLLQILYLFSLTLTGLHELTLSANKEVTPIGWTKFAMAMAAGCHLQSLYVDYNPLGDHSINSLAVAVATTKSLRFLDFEACDITNVGAQVIIVR